MKPFRLKELNLASILLFLILFTNLSCSTSKIKKPHLDAKKLQSLYSKYQNKEVHTFKQFLNVLNSDKVKLGPTKLKTLLQRKNLNAHDEILLYRLMGLYNRIKNKKAILNTLKELVAIPTFKIKKKEQYKNPEIIKFGNKIKNIANNFGLNFKNVDNRVFEVTLPGKTDKDFGILTHADVVPVDKSKWKLPNGKKIDPFKAEIFKDRIYGRGTEDDKCSIVAAMYAMKEIKKAGLQPRRSIRLMIETTEETGGDGFKYYKKISKIPSHNIVLDSAYPMVSAEKGWGSINLNFPKTKKQNKEFEIISITGGTTSNQIPSSSTAIIKAPNQDSILILKKLIKLNIRSYVQANGGNFKIDTTVKDKHLEVTVHGQSAHSASPQSGVNPIPRLIDFLLKTKIKFAHNHYLSAMKFTQKNLGLGYYGKKLGVNYSDDFMGPLTVSLTYLEENEKNLKIVINMRAPRGKRPEILKKEVLDKLVKYQSESKESFSYKVIQTPYMFRNPKGEWIKVLLSTFGESTGLASKPISIGGSTTAKLLPNAVNFGPSMPGEKYRGHNANEYKKISNFMMDVQMFTEMLLRIGNLETL